MKDLEYLDLLEESPNAIFRVSLDGIIQYANAACQPLFAHCGCSVGGSCPPFLFEDISQARVEEIDLQTSTYTLQINPCVEKGYISVFAQDITDQKKAEVTVQESKAQYQLLVEEANDIIYWVNTRGEFTYLNPQASKILKRSAEEIEGKHFSFPIREDWKTKAVEFYKKQLSDISPISYFEFPVIDSEGNEIWLGQNVKILEVNGEVRGFHAVARDITEHMKMEKSLKEAKEKAEISLKSQEMFLANMSHEIRTPLNGILGMSQLISKEKLSSKNSNYLSSIRNSAKHLLSIINDLLDLSKVESGKMELESTGMVITEILDNVVTTAQYSTTEKSIYIINETDESLDNKVFLGDPVRLSQVLTNVIGNAIKFTEEGEVKISSKLISSNDGVSRILFSVKDSGIGIPADKIDTIFESFKQADNDTTRKYGGTGLGLSICKQLVELMDGEIQVESEVGQGTTFNIECSFAEGERESLPEKKEKNVRYSLEGVNVLLVEDNPVNQVYATTILENEKAIVDLAGNGKIAIHKLLSEEYDIVLMDGQMPEMGGIEATGIIRNKLEMDIPIIALTANALKGERDKYIAVGMNEYVSKPFEDIELINAIGKLLNLKEKDADQLDYLVEDEQILETTHTSYDLTKLYTFSEGDTKFVDQMISLFEEEIPKSLMLFAEHLQNEDYEGIRAVAHDMKSTVDLMGIDIQEELQEIESLGSNRGDMKRIKYLSRIVIDFCNHALMDLKYGSGIGPT